MNAMLTAVANGDPTSIDPLRAAWDEAVAGSGDWPVVRAVQTLHGAVAASEAILGGV